MPRISAIHLRTTDLERARAFYVAVLGTQDLVVFPMHEQALARGARPHWLGFIDVPNLDRGLTAALTRGATKLGPSWRTVDGREAGVIRDPGGAVVALAESTTEGSSSAPLVVWYQLNAAQLARTKDFYRAFGWRCDEPEGEPTAGMSNHPFAWSPETPPIGAMADIADRPGVHPHWLYHFAVPSLEDALEQVRNLGGLALPPLELLSGARVAVCDDAKGAAFALVERPFRSRA